MDKALVSTKPAVKPLGVSIKSINTVAMATQMGAPALMIIGLGDDNKCYQYDGVKQEWLVQG